MMNHDCKIKRENQQHTLVFILTLLKVRPLNAVDAQSENVMLQEK